MRQARDLAVKVLSAIAAMLGIAALAWVLYVGIRKGTAAMNMGLFVRAVTPPGVQGGGVGNAIVGSLILVATASIIGVPLGIMTGVYLSEFGRHTRFGTLVRFAANVIMGVPSIIVGLFVYTLLVVPMGRFSGWAGAAALAVIILPVVSRTTEDILALVPNTLRESGLALGSPRWKVTVGVVFRAAKAGLLTGVLLAVARASGETAPLLFTCLNSPYWPQSMNGPVANLPVTIFNCAMSPYADWQELAWGASLLITVGVLALTLITRVMLRRR
jgi:phosphate transport system permease protein